MLVGHLDVGVWIYNTYDNNFAIENDLANYSKESCWFIIGSD